MNHIVRYIRLWWIITLKTNQKAFISRLGAGIFLFGKFLRFLFFLLFIILLFNRIHTIGGYSFWQIVFLFLTFNLVDTLTQLFFREVYRFRNLIITGDFDHYLTKPISPLFRALLGGSDVLDVPLLIPITIGLFIAAFQIGGITPLGILFYIALIINGLLISLSFHIFVVSLGILTTEVDNAIMVYRDLTSMGRLPIDIYREPVRGILTFVFPIAVMMTYPYKALVGKLSFPLLLFSFAICAFLLFLSLSFWKKAIRQYTSASS